MAYKNNDEQRAFYDERRLLGLCQNCDKKTGINLATKKPYARCLEHRLRNSKHDKRIGKHEAK